jgi:hypothetical protein
MNREERIKALLANEYNPLKDQKALEAASDDTLKALEVHCEADAKELSEEEFLEIAPESVRTAVAAGRAAAAKEKTPPTEEEFLASAPESIKTLVAEKKAADAALKTSLIKTLKEVQSEYTEAELQSMGVKMLGRLARVANVEEPEEVDFSGQGMARHASTGAEDVYANPPDSYALALAAMKK